MPVLNRPQQSSQPQFAFSLTRTGQFFDKDTWKPVLTLADELLRLILSYIRDDKVRP